MLAFKVDENTPVLVEFTPRPGVRQVSRGTEDMVAKSAEALDGAMNTIRQMARRVHATVEDLAARPGQVEVEFGIKFDAEAGAIIAKTGIEASLTVKLSWGT